MSIGSIGSGALNGFYGYEIKRNIAQTQKNNQSLPKENSNKTGLSTTGKILLGAGIGLTTTLLGAYGIGYFIHSGRQSKLLSSLWKKMPESFKRISNLDAKTPTHGIKYKNCKFLNSLTDELYTGKFIVNDKGYTSVIRTRNGIWQSHSIINPKTKSIIATAKRTKSGNARIKYNADIDNSKLKSYIRDINTKLKLGKPFFSDSIFG